MWDASFCKQNIMLSLFLPHSTCTNSSLQNAQGTSVHARDVTAIQLQCESSKHITYAVAYATCVLKASSVHCTDTVSDSA